MTPREFAALRRVWMAGIERSQYMHAAIQSTLYNAHFDTGGVPWTPEDLLGKGDRQERIRQKQADRMETFRFSHVLSKDDDMIPEFIADLGKGQKVQ
jgi:hypothetical protein